MTPVRLLRVPVETQIEARAEESSAVDTIEGYSI
jgi:hypothetical protein